MTGSFEDRAWRLVGIVVALLNIAVPVRVAYDLLDRGNVPVRRVTLSKPAVIDPMHDLSALAQVATLALQLDHESISNIAISKAVLRNVGTSPIEPKDYHEKISVNVKAPWRIVSVNNAADSSSGVEFKWTKTSDTRFEAEPALLNPGDLVSTLVYLTNTALDQKPADTLDLSKADVEWKTRITHLASFEEPSTAVDGAPAPSGLAVYLSGWALPFMLAAALAFQALYLRLLYRAGLLRFPEPLSVALLLASTLMSVSAADAIAETLIPTDVFGLLVRLVYSGRWVNFGLIAINAAALIGLWFMGRGVQARPVRAAAAPVEP